MNGDDFKKYIGENIAKIRKFRGYSQEYMSEAIDIAPNSYGRIERGQNFPSAESFAKIIDTLKIKPADLFNFPNEESDEKIKKEIYRKLQVINLMEKIIILMMTHQNFIPLQNLKKLAKKYYLKQKKYLHLWTSLTINLH